MSTGRPKQLRQMLERHAREMDQLLRESGAPPADNRQARGRWVELRAYRRAREEFDRITAKDPRDWRGCAYGRDTALTLAVRDLHQRREQAELWGLMMRTRAEQHAAADN